LQNRFWIEGPSAMVKTGLLGPYPLSYESINEIVVRRSPGTFALGYVDAGGRFRVRHVGRSDSDVAEKLLRYIGAESLFKFSYFETVKAAFEKECHLFHDFEPALQSGSSDAPTWDAS
jgi:hypothetical protein